MGRPVKIYKVTLKNGTLLHAPGKAYVYLCELCRIFYQRWHQPESKAVQVKGRKCDWNILCRVGSDLVLIATAYISRRENKLRDASTEDMLKEIKRRQKV